MYKHYILKNDNRLSMFLVDKRYLTLFVIFQIYFFISLFLVYYDNVVYLFSDEQTFHDWALKISNSNLDSWWVQVQQCYVGIFPNSNAFFTAFWYSVIYEIANIFNIEGVLFLRFINCNIGFLTSLIVIRYIQNFSKVNLSFFEILMISLPFLFFSPTLLRDNYAIMFTFLGLIYFREKKNGWLLKLILCGLIIFLFRHVSLIFFILLIFSNTINNSKIFSFPIFLIIVGVISSAFFYRL